MLSVVCFGESQLVFFSAVFSVSQLGLSVVCVK